MFLGRFYNRLFSTLAATFLSNLSANSFRHIQNEGRLELLSYNGTTLKELRNNKLMKSLIVESSPSAKLCVHSQLEPRSFWFTDLSRTPGHAIIVTQPRDVLVQPTNRRPTSSPGPSPLSRWRVGAKKRVSKNIGDFDCFKMATGSRLANFVVT